MKDRNIVQMREEKRTQRGAKEERTISCLFLTCFPRNKCAHFMWLWAVGHSSQCCLSWLEPPVAVKCSAFCLRPPFLPALVGLINIVIQTQVSISRCSPFVIERSFEGGGREDVEYGRKGKASCCLMSGLLIQKRPGNDCLCSGWSYQLHPLLQRRERERN